MPTVFREQGFRFFFCSNEGSPREQVHIHVDKDDMEAKFWLEPGSESPTMMVMTPEFSANCLRSSSQIGI
jgi:hypothetical protein